MDYIKDFSKQHLNNFLFQIDKLPGLEFYVTGIPCPSISSNGVEQNLPESMRFSYPSAGLNFEELIVTCLIDEKMLYYNSITNWILNNDAKTDLDEKMFGNARLTVLANNKVDKIMDIDFVDCWPSMISLVDLNIAGSDTATFFFNLRYHYPKFKHYNEDELLIQMDERSKSKYQIKN